MLVRRTLATTALTGLVLGVLQGLPAHADTVTTSAGTSEPEQPLTVIALTDAEGERTPVAVEGIEQLETELAESVGAHTALGGAGSVGPFGAGAPTAAVTRPAAATQVVSDDELEDVAVLTPPMATEEFLVAGLIWEPGGTLPEGGRVFLRVLEDGVWSDWLETHHEEGLDAGVQAEGAAGTEPFVTGGADAVQIQVTGDAAELPAGLQVSLIPANPVEPEEVLTEPTETPDVVPEGDPTATAEPNVTTEPAVYDGGAGSGTFAAQAVAATGPAMLDASLATPTATAAPAAVMPTGVTAPAPKVVSRAGWGANSSYMTWAPRYDQLRAAVVHHTAGTNNYAPSESASIVRGIYYYHAVTRDWGDIGYNFLVDKWGTVFEGRTGSVAAPAGTMTRGAHAAPFNSNTLGISAMGDYTKVDAPQAILDSMADVIAWKFAAAGIDMSSGSGMISPGTPAMPAGRNLPRVFGHRDVSATACPGLDIYGRIPGLIRAVDATMPQLFHLNNAFDATADVTFRYGDRGAEVFVGDWDGDGVDTVATRVGQVFSVRNSNSYGEADIVFAYGRPDDVVLVGDWDGDGKDTLAVRRGKQYLVRNSVTTGPADQVVLYGRADDEVLVGDWDGNGRDSFTVRRGATYYVKNTIANGVADHVIAYGRPDDVVLAGDWDGNGRDSFAVRRGAQYLIRNTISSGHADIEVIYGRSGDLVLVGDWNGDGTDTLGVRRP